MMSFSGRMKSKRGWKAESQEHQRVVQTALNFFLNDAAFYVETIPCHKFFFDIFFELSMSRVKNFKMSLR